MPCASHILRQSNKLRSSSSLVRKDQTVLLRWFSSNSRSSVDNGDHLSKFHKHGSIAGDRSGASMHSGRRFTTSLGVRNRCSVSTLGERTKLDAPIAGLAFKPLMSWFVFENFANYPFKRAQKISPIFGFYVLSSQMQSMRCFSTNSDLPPHQEIGMPSLSPTMTEGNIARWLKKEGDKVSPGEVLCEVETDKATVEMECMEEGYIAKILQGDVSNSIKVGEVIAITVEEEEDIAKFKDYTPSASDAAPKAAPKEPSSPTPPKETAQKSVSSPEPTLSKPSARPASEGRIFASPVARKLAEDNNVPLSSIEGTGPDGRIVKVDVEEYLASHSKGAPAAASKVGNAIAGGIDYVDIPHSQIRKVTASRLLLSKQTIPHYYLTVDTCVDKLVDLRGQLNSLVEASGGKKISINDFVIKAVALALRKVPPVNSSWTDDYIRQYTNVNINVAVQTDNGLYVPVVRDADKKGLGKISEEVKHLAQRAKENSLKPEDYEGGTFTVSNLGGPFGVKQFCAIVNPPQAAILAVGSAEKRVIPGSGSDQFNFASFMSVTLSCDHRVIDGAVGAEWLKAFKGYIENPQTMLL